MKELWVLGFLINVFLLASVFDIYFKSPIVDVHEVHSATRSSGIKRIVFFVADGLRYDTFSQNPSLRPRLTNLIEKNDKVAWGISDTRVPTESRPGHIALFAGFYEDPSAVFTGWKNNLVQFDSVFNRTNGAVAIGSPDVVLMFAQGAAKSKIYSETYPSDWQDFLAANSSVLDTWVFDRFRFLAESSKLPQHDNLLIFLHLLGIDNTGHATKPHSIEYKQGLSVVDEIVSKVEEIISNYYKDNNTLFIFTSDHGMTDWGSHGSGSQDETKTPFVIWGPGIKNTNNFRIKQADMTALIAGALGSAFPTNSIGKFPFKLWQDIAFAYSALKANFLQIKQLMKTKKERIALERTFPLIEFDKENHFLQLFVQAEMLAEKGEYLSAMEELENAFTEVFEGNVYYERYDQQLLIMFSVMSFILLMALVASVVISMGKVDQFLDYTTRIFSVQYSLIALFCAFILTKGLIGWSVWKIGYGFVPIYLALLVATEIRLRQKILSESIGGLKKLLCGLGLSALGIQMLVLSFFERSVLSLALILNLVWALLVQKKSKDKDHHKGKEIRGHLLFMHLVAVGSLALFPLVPIIGNSQSPFFITGGPLISSVLVVGLVLKMGSGFLCQRDKMILGVQLALQCSVAVLIHFPTFIMTRLVSWMSLGLLFLAPTLTSSEGLTVRLLSIFLAIGTPFSFLGVSYETLFLPSLFLVLLLLFKLEVDEGKGTVCTEWGEFLRYCTQDTGERGASSSREKINVHRAFRRAWFHLFFVFLSFFGTGNIGSVSSFDPSSTRCFVSVFNPWVMMVLMLTKILGPFLLVSSFWRALLPSTVEVERNFGILLLLSQGMGLDMFFRVTNQGSWLQIGTSISHFVIVQSTTLFLFLLHFVADFLITFQLFPSPELPNNFAKPKYKAAKGH